MTRQFMDGAVPNGVLSLERASDVMTHNTQTNKLKLWIILNISLRANASVPKTLVRRKLRLHSLYFHHTTLMLTESRGNSVI